MNYENLSDEKWYDLKFKDSEDEFNIVEEKFSIELEDYTRDGEELTYTLSGKVSIVDNSLNYKIENAQGFDGEESFNLNSTLTSNFLHKRILKELKKQFNIA